MSGPPSEAARLAAKGGQGAALTQKMWMLLAATAGIDDEVERARLVATGLSSVLPCSSSGLALLDPTRVSWVLVLQQGDQLLPPHSTGEVLRELESVFQEALHSPTAIIALADCGEAEGRLPSSIAKLGTSRMALVPLRTLRGPLGILLAGRKSSSPFSRDDEVLLLTIAQHLGIGIENLRLYRMLKQHSENLEHAVEERTEKLRRAEERRRVPQGSDARTRSRPRNADATAPGWSDAQVESPASR